MIGIEIVVGAFFFTGVVLGMGITWFVEDRFDPRSVLLRRRLNKIRAYEDKLWREG